MSLIQDLVSPSKYDIKCPYEMEPIGHCIHNTANDASAKNEVSYMKSNNNEVSFHVAVDHLEARQGIPFNRNAWATGDGGKGTGNRKYIHWEICYSKSGGNNFLEAEKRCAKEIAADLKARGWGIDRVKKHQDFSGKYCPHRTLDMGFQRILDMIKAELGNVNNNTPQAPSSPITPTGAMYRAVAGSYSVRANAEAQQIKLKADGYDSFLLSVVAADGKTYLRVIAGSFKDKATADKRVAELVSKGYNAFVAAYDSNNKAITSSPTTQTTTSTTSNPALGVGNKVNITATHYSTGQVIPAEQKGSKVHTIKQISGDKALLAEIFSWVPLTGLKLAGTTVSTNTIPSKGKCTITTSSGIKFRNKASVKNGVVQGTYSCGESVTYDSVVTAEGYTWISWISASKGVRRYMPIIDHSNGEKWAKCI